MENIQWDVTESNTNSLKQRCGLKSCQDNSTCTPLTQDSSWTSTRFIKDAGILQFNKPLTTTPLNLKMF